LIEKHRKGDAVNERLIREIIDSYVALGGSDDPPLSAANNAATTTTGGTVIAPAPSTSSTDSAASLAKLGIYKNHFEAEFLDSTNTFYMAEALSLIQSSSIPDYLKSAEKRLLEEERRVGLYLHESTLPLLLSQVEGVII
jgi:cullin 1